VDLTTANPDRDFDRLNLDVIEDLRRLMRMAEGAQKLDLDRFADLMLKIEVQSLGILFYNPSSLVGGWSGLVDLGFPELAN